MGRTVAALESGIVYGSYRLGRQLGRSFFGETFLSHNRETQQVYVHKFLRRMTSDDINKYSQEKAPIALLRHAHITPATANTHVRIGGKRIIVETPYYTAGSLAQRHPPGTRLPPITAIAYAEQIGEALSHAHQQGIVHMNIKPENILIDRDGKLVLSDFTTPLLIKRWLASLKNEREVPRTLFYTAPEQLRGKWQPASDQYSLATMIYEWLCGRPPLRGTISELRSQHSVTPPPPMELAQSSVERAVVRALDKEPLQRFSSIEAFVHALREY